MKSRHNSKTYTLTMSYAERATIMRFLNFIEKRRGIVFGQGVFDESDIARISRALETALARSEPVPRYERKKKGP